MTIIFWYSLNRYMCTEYTCTQPERKICPHSLQNRLLISVSNKNDFSIWKNIILKYQSLVNKVNVLPTRIVVS